MKQQTLAATQQYAIAELGLTDSQRQAASIAVKTAMEMGAEHAAASYYYSTGTDLSIRKQKVEQQEHYTEQGLNITVYCKQHSGSTSTNALDHKSIQGAVKKALDVTKWTEKDPYCGLPQADLLIKDLSLDLDLYHKNTFTTEQAKQMALECEAIALQENKLLTQCEESNISMQENYQSLANSYNFDAESISSSYSMACSLLAKQNEAMQRDYEYTTSCNPNNLLTPRQLAIQAATKTISRLGARKIATCTAEVVFSPQVAKTIWGAMIQALSGSSQYRKKSFLQQTLGKNILPNWANIEQKPHIPGAIGSRLYDSEGVATTAKPLIENGMVSNYLLSSYSARALGLQTTANSGGINNLIINPNIGNLDKILSAAKNGLYITEIMGQGVNATTGDYSQGAFGFWFENGAIKYPVHEITIAGNLIKLLKEMQASGNDIDLRSKIRCGSLWLGKMTIAGS